MSLTTPNAQFQKFKDAPEANKQRGLKRYDPESKMHKTNYGGKVLKGSETASEE